MAKRKTAEDYHALAQARGFKWLGPEVYNGKDGTWFECSNGHKWESGYNRMQQGHGCPFCAGKIQKTPADYYRLAAERGLRWLGPEVRRIKDKTWFVCPLGHRWETGYGRIQAGHGCWYCGIEKHSRTQGLKPADYHALASERGFTWMGPEVKNRKTGTEWQCKYGHVWKAPYHGIKSGNGCSVCKESKGEKRIDRALRDWGIHFTRQKTFDACKSQKHLPFDFYFQLGSKYFLVEYDGELHFVNRMAGESALLKTQHHDAIKTQFAKDHNFVLIRIPYTEFNNIESILRAEIEKHTGQPLESIRPNQRTKTKVNLDPSEYHQGRLV